ncbi:hypothetical protein HZH68_012156 [Vespula germanica]|uniref:Uncharacterized protein n=1 Tax=Vespula germanica TaxID=30212 RepID=A0A834JP20_VESGE|nr:hypothetical protein HZH68_012156 [Vespula germanica]
MSFYLSSIVRYKYLFRVNVARGFGKGKEKVEKKMESGNAINHRDLQDHRDHRSTSSPHPLEKFLVRKVRSRQRDQDESTRAETKRKKRPYRR